MAFVLASDFDSDDERQSLDVVLWRIQRTAVVALVGRLYVFDHQCAAVFDAEPTLTGRLTGVLDDPSASRPDYQPMWWVILRRTLDASRQTTAEVGSSEWPRGDQLDRAPDAVCLRHRQQRCPGRRH